VAAHYDLSNEFFSLMLDPTMSYSCAVFDDPGADLEVAQQAKLDRLFDLLDLGPDDHLLEIGTGWGGLATRAAATRGCRVTTTTISAEQHRFASQRVAALGLADRVTVLDHDYRDLGATYDKVVSVEMIEAVDWRDHATFFETLAARVRPGGRAVLQAIVIDDRGYERAKRQTDFIKVFVFPGGCLPSVASIQRSASATGELRTHGVHRIGHHYAETLRRWQHNVDAHRAEIAALGFDDRGQRIWDLYLQYCIGAFESRHIDTVQIVLDRQEQHGALPHDDRVLTAA
jgi:cyclopropane-fatty-acyl-phospholipid synthase